MDGDQITPVKMEAGDSIKINEPYREMMISRSSEVSFKTYDTITFQQTQFLADILAEIKTKVHIGRYGGVKSDSC